MLVDRAGGVGQALAFRRQELLPIADRLRAEFRSATPFPHVVIDDFLPEAVLDEVLDEFPEPEQIDWQQFDNSREVKLALADAERMGPTTRHLLAEFNSAVFVDFLTSLTGIERLIPDPHYSGGGLHQIRRGGYLKVHADFNKHPELDLYRRLNAILYLNKDWQDEWGGDLPALGPRHGGLPPSGHAGLQPAAHLRHPRRRQPRPP